MANKLILKNGAGIPAPEKLEVAELALDTEDGSLYSKLGDGTVVQLNGGGGGGEGAGSSVHIGAAPPADPQEGQQWMEIPPSGEAKMWVYDNGNGGQWLQQPGSSGGGSDVDATFIEDYEYHQPDVNGHQPDVWKFENLASDWFHATEVHIDTINSSRNPGEFRFGINSSWNYGAFIGGIVACLENLVLGGINISAIDEARPDLPFDLDDEELAAAKAKARSIQYALTVTHETLGRTVEIDKEGIIRANQFTDMNGNPMSVSPATMVDAFTTLQKAIADEDTLEGVKSALTNSLGGLIEKFEAMSND